METKTYQLTCNEWMDRRDVLQNFEEFRKSVNDGIARATRALEEAHSPRPSCRCYWRHCSGDVPHLGVDCKYAIACQTMAVGTTTVNSTKARTLSFAILSSTPPFVSTEAGSGRVKSKRG